MTSIDTIRFSDSLQLPGSTKGWPLSRLTREGDILHSACGDSGDGRVWADVVDPRDTWGRLEVRIDRNPPPPIVIL